MGTAQQALRHLSDKSLLEIIKCSWLGTLDSVFHYFKGDEENGFTFKGHHISTDAPLHEIAKKTQVQDRDRQDQKNDLITVRRIWERDENEYKNKRNDSTYCFGSQYSTNPYFVMPTSCCENHLHVFQNLCVGMPSRGGQTHTKEPSECENCGSTNHKAGSCPWICRRCGGNHSIKDCDEAEEEDDNPENQFCAACGEYGHSIYGCQVAFDNEDNGYQWGDEADGVQKYGPNGQVNW